MKKILEKIIVGFFVFVFGTMWLFSNRYYERPEKYTIVAYNVLGSQNHLDGIKTSFRYKDVAKSFLKEYQSRFPQYSFSLEEHLPTEKRRMLVDIILNKNRKN